MRDYSPSRPGGMHVHRVAGRAHPVGIGGERGRSERGESASAPPGTFYYTSFISFRSLLLGYETPLLITRNRLEIVSGVLPDAAHAADSLLLKLYSYVIV